MISGNITTVRWIKLQNSVFLPIDTSGYYTSNNQLYTYVDLSAHSNDQVENHDYEHPVLLMRSVELKSA